MKSLPQQIYKSWHNANCYIPFGVIGLVLLLASSIHADCILATIIGNGSDVIDSRNPKRTGPYRPDIPPGYKWSAHIPSNKDGTPMFADSYVCFPRGVKPPGTVPISTEATKQGILSRDPAASVQRIDQVPAPEPIRGSLRDFYKRAYRLAGKYLGPALAWATSATDDFNRADGGLGANWSAGYGSESTATIVSNAAECAIGARCVGSYNAFTPGADQYAQGVVAQYNIGNDGDVAVAVRMPAPTSFDGYFARAGLFNANGPGSTTLSKRVAGVNTGLAADSTYPVWTTPGTDVLRLEVVGTALTVKRNGGSILTATDSTHTTGRGGILLNSLNSSSSSDTARLDDFEVGDLGAPAKVVRRRPLMLQ